jgi:hypothetical protein
MALEQATHTSPSISLSSFLSSFIFNDDAFSTFYLMTAVFNSLLLFLPALRRSKEQKIVHTSAEPGLFLKSQHKEEFLPAKFSFMVHAGKTCCSNIM